MLFFAGQTDSGKNREWTAITYTTTVFTAGYKQTVKSKYDQYEQNITLE